jgi:hypothetical protein
MASAVGTKRKAATIARVVKFDRGCAKSVPEAEGWAAKWGAKLEALTLPTAAVDEEYRAESMRSPRGGLMVDSDGSMRRQRIASIGEKRAQRNKMLLGIWESDKVPPYMNERQRQLRYKIAAFRKKRAREGQDFRDNLVPARTDSCALCFKQTLPEDQYLVGEFEWGCLECRHKEHNHGLGDATRSAIDRGLTDLLTTISMDSKLYQLVKDLRTVRDLIVKRASEKKESLNSSKMKKRPSTEENAFEVIYGTPIVSIFEASHLTLDELKELETYETNLEQQVRIQHQSLFAEDNMETLIAKSVRNRQNAFLRQSGACDRLDPEDGKRVWDAQGGRCDLCQERLYWNWAAAGQASLAQLDRVDVSKLTYVDNCVWLCQACNANKGYAVDTLAYDRHFLEALEFTKANVGDASSEDKIIVILEQAKQLLVSRQILNNRCTS